VAFGFYDDVPLLVFHGERSRVRGGAAVVALMLALR